MVFKPLRIGVYGVSGVGKTSLLNVLEKYGQSLQVIDGSKVIGEVVEGGLQSFKASDQTEKREARRKAVARLQELHVESRKHTVIAGHFCFFGDNGYDIAWTDADAAFYDVIFLLHKSPEKILVQSQGDFTRCRNYSVEQLSEWQDFEYQGLKKACRLSGTRFYPLDGDLDVNDLENDFIEKVSITAISVTCNDIINSGAQSVALFDCDGTLNHDDIYNYCSNPSLDQITSIFKRYPDYCQDAFVDVSNFLDFEIGHSVLAEMLDNAKKSLTIHPCIYKQLHELRSLDTIIVFVSCGFPEAWSAAGFQADYLVGGASFGLHGCLVTHQSKRQLAELLTGANLQVSAFGNGSVDIEMLLRSHKAYYVYSDKRNKKHIAKLKGHEDLNFVKLEGM